MKRLFLFIFIIVLTGCTNPAKKDLLNYINYQLPKIIELESEAISKYEEMIANDNYTNKDLYQTLSNNIIPKYELFVEQLKKITPKTKEVESIHNLHIKGAQKQLQALRLLQKGIKENNDEKIKKANSLLKESKTYMKSFKDEIVKLADKYRIKYKLE
ncbi:hypothetical protein [Thermohalobacter berrensis]|uniref:Lipoprotein n=1 Tax=Thermohalobacter berrensis TaxID=99594 RepID=A0A419T4V1_9FIRM|nr:hypothetical protein [Thermohalobacter berrensis]RKD32577.1 hypothetical protein BET03_10910 [Thermohalobacter berrensis]